MYQEYLESDKHVGMFEDKFSVNDAIRDDMITITKDNVVLYYGFMSDEAIAKNLNAILESKIFKISEMIKIDMRILVHFSTQNTVFGVKDTLKPIDEYIEEIKASNEYQSKKE